MAGRNDAAIVVALQAMAQAVGQNLMLVLVVMIGFVCWKLF